MNHTYSHCNNLRLNLLPRSRSHFRNPSNLNNIKEVINNNITKTNNKITINPQCSNSCLVVLNNLKTTSRLLNANSLTWVTYYYLFITLGKTCPYGMKCTFAHGDEDLKPPSMMPQ